MKKLLSHMPSICISAILKTELYIETFQTVTIEEAMINFLEYLEETEKGVDAVARKQGGYNVDKTD